MGVTEMAKSRQSNAVITFMARNYFAHFAHFAPRRRIEKQGILEKSCQHTIFILSNFNGGHRNGKKSFLPAVSSQNGQIDTKQKFQKLQNVITQPNQKSTMGIFAWAPETRFTR
jgi:hypothetical protein